MSYKVRLASLTKTTVITCPKCKKEIKSDNFVCEHCGCVVEVYVMPEDKFDI